MFSPACTTTSWQPLFLLQRDLNTRQVHQWLKPGFHKSLPGTSRTYQRPRLVSARAHKVRFLRQARYCSSAGKCNPCQPTRGKAMNNIRSKNGYRRRQIRARALRAYTTCHLCGQPIDKSLPAGDPWSAEVDEIIPVSKGGSPTRWDNVRLAHRICNEMRSNHSVEYAKTVLKNARKQTLIKPIEHDEI